MQDSPLHVLFVLVAAAHLLACGGDDPAPPGPSGASDAGTCPATNSQCKEIATVEAGSVAVQRRRCVQCHDGPLGTMSGRTTSLPTTEVGVELYPPNLTNDRETGTGAWSDDQLATAIRTGVDEQGLQLCPQMTHFADMTDFEVYSIVKYLRSIPAVRNVVPRSVCPPLKTKEEQAAAQ
jgi:hypothetical protein